MTSSTNTADANRLTETGFTYDERGNISGFTRYDASSQPTRYYLQHSNANRLVIANTDKGLFRGFSYDANGNQATAPNVKEEISATAFFDYSARQYSAEFCQ